MKINYCKCFIYACLIGAGVACSSEYNPVEEATRSREVTFRISEEESLGTKATATAFEIGDSIGVYAVRRTDPERVALPLKNGNQAHNAKLVKTAEGWTFATLADKIVYPHDGSKLDFYAYYPYDRNASDPEACYFKVKTNQNGENGFKASDFMVARNIAGMNEGEVSLTFSHALTMVKVKVSGGTGVVLDEGLKVQMPGMLTAVSYHLGNDMLTNGQETGMIVLNREAGNEAEYTYAGYLPAQAIEAGVPLFRCILGEKVYIYNSEAVELTRGNRTVFELTLKNEE